MKSIKKINSKLFTSSESLDDKDLSFINGGVNTDPCCDTDQATTVKDESESCADTVNNGTDFWADVKFIW